ncbi:MAG: hypothetical protein SOY97_06085 [Candidatus Metalachnospira sp.]|nr:hypothetical protein [Candidatus Metalachnospira sp.]
MKDIKWIAAQVCDLALDMEQINGLANVIFSAFTNDTVVIDHSMYLGALSLLSNTTNQFLDAYRELSAALKKACNDETDGDINEPKHLF